MQRFSLLALAFLVIAAGTFFATPAYARAPASFSASRALLIASSSPGNAYAVGISVLLTAPIRGDFAASGGSIVTAAPIQGDGFLLAGSIQSRARVAGDLRAAGGNVDIEEPVAGDLIAVGYSVRDASRAGGNVFIVAANARVSNGASGPVTIYGNTVSLEGSFASDVTVVASGRITLTASTTIAGALSYEAPEPAVIPVSATIVGGVTYTNATYLPDAGTSRALAFVSVGFFLLARILGALLLAGLLAGLFPRLAERLVERASTERPRRILLTTLLGFAILVAAPVLVALLALTFVGIGLALLLFILYALLVVLALLYAGILLGGLVARRYAHRETVLWHDGALGMLALSLVALVPFAGPLVALLLTLFSAGMLLQLFFQTAFPHEEQTPEML